MDKNAFTILGAGAWGTAVALVLAQDPKHRVSIWSARPENAKEMHAKRENVRLLPGIPIPTSIHLTIDLNEVADNTGMFIVAAPTVYLRTTLETIHDIIPAEKAMVSLCKGVENETFLRPTQVIRDLCGPRPVGVLSGPSHAEEVARGKPTTLVAASDDWDLANWIQRSFHTEQFRVYTNLDLIGVELGGALKNIIGIAAGICDGLGFGDNAKSALLTRGLVEMARFGVALGAEPQTFYGLAGLGDLITTSFSPHGRNRKVGERLGRGESLADIQQSMNMVAEGIFTTRSVYERSRQMGVSMPITTEVYRVLYEDKPPLEAVNDLMTREPKGEK